MIDDEILKALEAIRTPLENVGRLFMAKGINPQTVILSGWHIIPPGLTEEIEPQTDDPPECLGSAEIDGKKYGLGVADIGPIVHSVQSGRTWCPSWSVLIDMARDAGIDDEEW